MSATVHALMRLYLDDNDSDPQKQYFSPETLNLLLEEYDSDIYAAVSQGWRIKAASVADWYQANIDGTFLNRGEVFDHCMKMAMMYESYSGAGASNVIVLSPTKAATPEDIEPEFG